MNPWLMWRLCVAIVLCATSVVPVPAGADGGDVLWQIQGDSAGLGQIQYVTEDGNRLLAVGFAGHLNTPRLLVQLHDAATGAASWTHRDAAEGYVSHAVLKGARAYVAGGVQRSSAWGHHFLVRAYDAHTGSIVWEDRHDVSSSTPGEYGLAHAIAFAGGRLFAIGFYAGPTEGGTLIRAYDAATGRFLWQQNRPGEGFGSSDQRSMIALGGHVIVALNGWTPEGFAVAIVRAHSAVTGAMVWEDRYSAHDYGAARAAIWNVAGRVFVTADLGNSAGFGDLSVRAYEASSGTVLWHDVRSKPAPIHHASVGLASAGSYVVAAANMCDEEECPTLVRALDTETGALLWETVERGTADLTDVAIVGDRVISVGYAWGDTFVALVRAHDIRTGTLQWEDKRDVGSQPSYANAVSAASGRVIIGGASVKADDDRNILLRAYRPR